MAYNHTTPYHLHLNMYTIHLNHRRSAETNTVERFEDAPPKFRRAVLQPDAAVAGADVPHVAMTAQ